MPIQFDSIDEIQTAAGIPVVCRHKGQGELFFLFHGGSGSYTHWLRNIDPLAAHFHLVVLDLPGFGASGDVPPEITSSDYADLLADVVRQVAGPAAQFHMAGFSFGGMNACAVATRLPGRVLRMSFVAPSGFGPNPGPPLALRQRSRSMTPEDLREVYRHNLGVMMIHDASLIDEDTVSVHQNNIENARFRNRHLSRENTLEGYLAQLNIPLQFIYGGADQTADPSVTSRLERVRMVRPDARTHVIPDVGHWSQYESPEQVNTLLRDFHR